MLSSKFKILSFKKNGFTLFELLVVMSIIVILSGMVLANYRTGQRRLALQRAVNKVGQDIRRMQTMAGNGEEGCKTAGNFDVDYQYGYGIDLNTGNNKSYTLFADCNGDKTYNSGTDKIIENANIETYIEIGNLVPGPLVIVFVPPDPSVYINGGGANLATITFRIEQEISRTRNVIIHESGLIDVD
ncbi:MAG: type II secretion system protein [Candidatus Nealsonbacteria bacterium]